MLSGSPRVLTLPYSVAPHLVFSLHGELTTSLLRALWFPFWRTVVRRSIWARGVLTAPGSRCFQAFTEDRAGQWMCARYLARIHTSVAPYLCKNSKPQLIVIPLVPFQHHKTHFSLSLLTAPFSNIETPTSHDLPTISLLVHLQWTQEGVQTSAPTPVRDSFSP